MYKIKKIMLVLERYLIGLIGYISIRKYMKLYVRWLRRVGVNIPLYDNKGFIHKTADIDGSEYSLITIEKNVTISKNVIILVHDFSIQNAIDATQKKEYKEKVCFMKAVKIGENSFIGANSIILPGTIIGKNVIVGAGTVIKGKIPDNTIWIGNPATQCNTIDSFVSNHVNLKDFIQINN